MVLYKRKQVTFETPPEVPQDPNTEVFYIKQTKEWFLDYEHYLNRMDYYHRRKFVCEITGNSCLTFFEALESEGREIKGVEKNFPEALREHILRFLQFNRITRLDQLVDKVYLSFRTDYFPGETIFIRGALTAHDKMVDVQPSGDGSTYPSATSLRLRGVIREKVQYSNPSDGLMTKYLVSRLDDGQQAIVTKEKLSRDRNHFSKWLIKTFIKLTMSRSHKVGAPWVVKDQFAKKYGIPQVYPDDLKHFAPSTPGPVANNDKARRLLASQEDRLLSAKKKKSTKAIKKKSGLSHILENTDEPFRREEFRKNFPTHHLPDAVQRELQLAEEMPKDERSLSTPPVTYSSFQPTKKSITDDLHIKFDLQTSKPLPTEIALPENARAWNKYIVDDLKEEIAKLDTETEEKDKLLETKTAKLAEIKRLSSTKLASVQEALESWTFLNIFHTVLKLDTFTFDDFLSAMGWNYDQYSELGRCDLLDEIWCALIGAIVSNNIPSAKTKIGEDEVYGLQVNLPIEDSFITPSKSSKSGEESDDEENRGSDSEKEDKTLKVDDVESDEESYSDSETKKKKKEVEEYEEEAEDENEDDENEEDDVEDDENREHNAYTVINYRGTPWHERLRRRNYKDGNWQCIVLGILSLVDYVPHYEPIIDKVYKVLAPIDSPATPATALKNFYYSLDIDLKLKVLNILTSLLGNSSLVRDYIDECLDLGTVLRRNRLDNLRDYKTALDTAQRLHMQLFDKMCADETIKTKFPNLDPRRRPRLNLHVFEMTEDETEFAGRDAEFKEMWESRKQCLLKLQELKKAQREIELKLTEVDCQRVKLLGKDRLFNRYWWFENNGLPNLHASVTDDDEDDLPKETEDVDQDKDEVLGETYLMGRLWVQGPTNEDLKVNLNSSFEEAEKFVSEYSKYEDVELVPAEDQLWDLKDGKPPLRTMQFDKLPEPFRNAVSQLYKLDYKKDTIERHSDFPDPVKQEEIKYIDGDKFRLEDHREKNTPNTIIGKLGLLNESMNVLDLTPVERKIIEEQPDPLFNGYYWRCYDKPEDIDLLVQWLNPWGKRESQLRKDLISARDAIQSSMAARRKALWVDQIPDEVKKLQAQIDEVAEKIRGLESGQIKSEEEEIEEEESDGKKRIIRRKQTSRKRQKLSLEETIEFGSLDELIEVQGKLTEQLNEKKEEHDVSRVLEWVNQTAIDEFDKSLYEGGDKQVKKPAKKGKNK